MPTWTPKLAVGHPAIDAQHQELFEHADALLAAMATGRPADEVRRLIAFLDEYCSRHFATEERLMRRREYPDAARHLAEHADFVRQFQEVVQRFEARGASALLTLDLQSLVCDWLVRHVGRVDTQLAGFLAAGAAPV